MLRLQADLIRGKWSAHGHIRRKTTKPECPFRHPGYLLKTRGFPSQPRGGFGFFSGGFDSSILWRYGEIFK